MHTPKSHAVAIALVLFAATGLARAQMEMPSAGTVPAAAELKAHLEGRIMNTRFADGTEVRLEFKSNGYFWVNTSRGLNTSGTWQAQDGQLCSQLKGRDRSCNDVRMHEGVLYLKRDSGEVVRYQSS